MSSSEDEIDQINEESFNEEQETFDGNNSSSDATGESLDEETDPEKGKSEADMIRQTMLKKYRERQGKQLFIRFPHKIPEDNNQFNHLVKNISDLIVKAHKPRQKHARFCLVDFANTGDRDATLKKLHSKKESKVMVSLPRTESEEFVSELAEKKIKRLQNKRAKNRLKKQGKLALNIKTYTSSVMVQNIPKGASISRVKELFPNAVDIHIKPNKDKFNGTSVACITLSSTMEARQAIKRSLLLGGTKLKVRFAYTKLGKKRRKAQTKNVDKMNQL